jgi:hypothetical protein
MRDTRRRRCDRPALRNIGDTPSARLEVALDRGASPDLVLRWPHDQERPPGAARSAKPSQPVSSGQPIVGSFRSDRSHA